MSTPTIGPDPAGTAAGMGMASGVGMVPGRPPVLLFDGTGALLAQFSGASVEAAAAAFLPLVNDPNTALPLTLLDLADNRTVTIYQDGVTGLSWRSSEIHHISPADGPADPAAGGPRLDLLVLHTHDLSASREFYEALGLAFVREQHGSGPEHLAATLADGCVLELYPAYKARPAGSLRIGITVPAETLRDHMLATWPGSLRDPDGRIVVITVTGDPPKDDPDATAVPATRTASVRQRP